MRYSIFIPVLPKNITIDTIRTELTLHGLGEIVSVDIITSKPKHNYVFVYFNNWNQLNFNAIHIRQQLDTNIPCNLYIPSLSTFWKILKNKSTHPKNMPILDTISILDNIPTSIKPISKIPANTEQTVSLFDRIMKYNPSTKSDNDVRMNEIESRLTKLENYIYKHIS